MPGVKLDIGHVVALNESSNLEYLTRHFCDECCQNRFQIFHGHDFSWPLESWSWSD